MPDFEISPRSVTLSAGQSQAFQALQGGQPAQGVEWSLQPTKGAGEITPDGIYTAPRRVFRAQKPIVAARPAAGGSSATAVIELAPISFWIQFLGGYLLALFLSMSFVLIWGWDWLCPRCQPENLRISPPVVTLTAGQSQAFDANAPVQWNLEAPGIYTAPRVLRGEQKTFTVLAKTIGDSPKTARAEVFLSPQLGLALHPANAILRAGGSIDFSAVVSRAEAPEREPRSGEGEQAGAAGAGGGAPGQGEEEKGAGPVVEWLEPAIGTLSPIVPLGRTARFSVEAAAVDRPTTLKVFARLQGGGPGIAGAYVTVVPASSPLTACAGGADSGVARLLALIALMGAMGGIIHGISSFTTYVGNREFKSSWVWWYVFKPPLAALVALVVFLVFRAGFGAGDFALGAADCLKVAAFAGLIGLFAEPATLKLRDIFDTLFTPRDDPRRDAAGKVRGSGPTLVSLEPASVKAGQQVDKLTLHGTGFAAGCQVKIGEAEPRKPETPTATRLVVVLTAADVAKPGQVPVVVFNKPPDGEPSNTLFLTVAAP